MPDSLPRKGSPILHILFVCTGNICRSPTAERLAAAYAARSALANFTASSAGTLAVIGHPIHPDAVPVLESLGGDSSDFAARQLTPKIAAEADLVLTMTRAHRDRVLELAPQRLHRTFTLIEAALLASDYQPKAVSDLASFRPRLAANESLDVPDPIGQGSDVYAKVGARIADHLPPILELLVRDLD